MLYRSIFSSIFSKRFLPVHPALYSATYRPSYLPNSFVNNSPVSTNRMMSSKKIAPSLIPPGWSDDPTELAEISEDFPTELFINGDSFKMTALLFDTGKKSGCPDVLLECSKGHYYVWNMISDNVNRILAPKTLDKIVPELEVGKPRNEGIEFEELKGADSVYLEALPFSPSLIPPGWTADPARLAGFSKGFPRSTYFMDDSITMTARLYDTGRFSGCLDVLLECSKGKYYLWSLISGSVQSILNPKTLDEIIPRLEVGKPRKEKLKFEPLESVEHHVEFLPPKWS